MTAAICSSFGSSVTLTFTTLLIRLVFPLNLVGSPVLGGRISTRSDAQFIRGGWSTVGYPHHSENRSYSQAGRLWSGEPLLDPRR